MVKKKDKLILRNVMCAYGRHKDCQSRWADGETILCECECHKK